MAVLAANTHHNSCDRGELHLPVTSAVTLFAGSLAFLSETTGLLVAWADLAANKFVGVAKEKVVGTGTNLCQINDTGMILQKINVTGVSAIDDIGDLVYATNDNPNDCTLTPATNQKAIGKVVRYYGSSTKCDVLLFTAMEHSALY
jgi:hypothetical protein